MVDAPTAEEQKAELIEAAQLERQIAELREELEKAAKGGDDSAADDLNPHVQTKEAASLGDPVDISRQEYVQLYNTSDGRIVDVLPVMLNAKLSLKWRQGQMVSQELVGMPVWSLTPVERPDHEDLVCDLHPDGAMRETANALGITTVCPRIRIPNSYVKRVHMGRKHPTELTMLDKLDEDSRREEDRAIQEAHLSALEKLAAANSGGGISADQLSAIIAAIKGDGTPPVTDTMVEFDPGVDEEELDG